MAGVLFKLCWASIRGPYLQKYGLVLTDIATNLLFSHDWKELLFRVGIDSASFLLDGWPKSVGRYALSHGMLFYDFMQDVLARRQPAIKGFRSIFCLNGQVCDAVSIYYYAQGDDGDHSCLLLRFNKQTKSDESVNVTSPMETALMNLHRWAQAEGVDKISLHPDFDDDGLLVLSVCPWRAGKLKDCHLLPGNYGSAGANAVWWTTLLSQRDAQFSEYELVNPLHEDILTRLVTLLSGEEISPAHISGHRPDIGNNGLLLVNPGEGGGLIIDSHVSQNYELPDIYLNVSQKAGERLQLETLYRTPAPARGLYRLVRRLIRITLSRLVFSWAINHLSKTGGAIEDVEEQARSDASDSDTGSRDRERTVSGENKGTLDKDETTNVFDEAEDPVSDEATSTSSVADADVPYDPYGVKALRTKFHEEWAGIWH